MSAYAQRGHALRHSQLSTRTNIQHTNTSAETSTQTPSRFSLHNAPRYCSFSAGASYYAHIPAWVYMAAHLQFSASVTLWMLAKQRSGVLHLLSFLCQRRFRMFIVWRRFWILKHSGFRLYWPGIGRTQRNSLSQHPLVIVGWGFTF